MKRLLLLVGMIFLIPHPSRLFAQPWIAKHGLDATQYQQAFNDLSKQGYYPKMVTGYSLNNQANYAALWQKTNITASEFRNGMTAAQYQTTFDDMQKRLSPRLCTRLQRQQYRLFQCHLAKDIRPRPDRPSQPDGTTIPADL